MAFTGCAFCITIVRCSGVDGRIPSTKATKYFSLVSWFNKDDLILQSLSCFLHLHSQEKSNVYNVICVYPHVVYMYSERQKELLVSAESLSVIFYKFVRRSKLLACPLELNFRFQGWIWVRICCST